MRKPQQSQSQEGGGFKRREHERTRVLVTFPRHRMEETTLLCLLCKYNMFLWMLRFNNNLRNSMFSKFAGL